jgi:hypothetical protein
MLTDHSFSKWLKRLEDPHISLPEIIEKHASTVKKMRNEDKRIEKKFNQLPNERMFNTKTVYHSDAIEKSIEEKSSCQNFVLKILIFLL